MRGTAVVASGSGGLAEMVQPGRTGTLAAPGSSDGLAEAMLPLLDDREHAERTGAEARRFALARLGLDTHVEAFLGIYREVCG